MSGPTPNPAGFAVARCYTPHELERRAESGESSGLVGVEGACPFDVPPFDAGHHAPQVRFVWWSWHPNYPYWAKSGWWGETQDKAWEALANPMAGSMRLYHNKLVREGDGAFAEVYDLPCQEMGVWREIADQRRAGGGGAEPVRADADGTAREGYNDPKLSEPRSGRDSCRGGMGEGGGTEAGGVTT